MASTWQPPKRLGSTPSMFYCRPEHPSTGLGTQSEHALAASHALSAAHPWPCHLGKEREASSPPAARQNRVLNPGHSTLLTQAPSSCLPCCMPCPAKYCLKTTKLLLCGVYSDSPGSQEERKGWASSAGAKACSRHIPQTRLGRSRPDSEQTQMEAVTGGAAMVHLRTFVTGTALHKRPRSLHVSCGAMRGRHVLRPKCQALLLLMSAAALHRSTPQQLTVVLPEKAHQLGGGAVIAHAGGSLPLAVQAGLHPHHQTRC